MEFGAAQRALIAGNAGGAPGVLVSGVVWLIAGWVYVQLGIGSAFAALFLGGMLIVPLSLAIARGILRAPKVPPGNPLERLGLESTFYLFGALLVGYGLLHVTPKLVFPVLAILIGARYFVFRTLYDEVVYWLLAVLLILAGALALTGVVAWPGTVSFVVGVTEIVVAMFLFVRFTRRRNAG